jgi:hypothetical protein
MAPGGGVAGQYTVVVRKRGKVKVFVNFGFYTFRLIVHLDLDLDVHVEASVRWDVEVQ